MNPKDSNSNVISYIRESKNYKVWQTGEFRRFGDKSLNRIVEATDRNPLANNRNGPAHSVGKKKNLGNKGVKKSVFCLSVRNAPKGKKLGVQN